MPETIPTLSYGKVVGRFMAIVGDTLDDSDDLPDGMPLSGEVVFTPVVDSILVPGSNPPITVIPQAVTAVLDAQGYLTLNGTRGIKLMASVNPSAVPSQFPYNVSFDKLRFGTSFVKYAAFRFNLPADGTIDLTTVAPVSNTGAVVNVVNQAALDQAVAAAEVRIVAALAGSGSGSGGVDQTARDAAADAQADADDAFLLANSAKTSAGNADVRAGNALTAAATADAKAVAASTAASTADGKAVAAQTTATNAATAATTADGKAVAASTAAATADAKAVTADGKAVAAQTTATNAATAASTADGKAVAASNAAATADAKAVTADGKAVAASNAAATADAKAVAAQSTATNALNAMPTILVLASSTSTVPGGTAPNTLVITPSAA